MIGNDVVGHRLSYRFSEEPLGGVDSFALCLESFRHAADALAHLLVGIPPEETTQHVRRVAVVEVQLGAAIIRCDAEVGDRARDWELEGFKELLFTSVRT